MKQNQFMLAALKQAEIAFSKNEVPVGCVIIEKEKVIAASYNQNISLNDPTAHAEILALRQAALLKNSHRLDDCDLYVTLEPCVMCVAAISLSRIRRIYYSLSDKKFGAIENGIRFFSLKSSYHKPEIYSGFSEQKSKELLVDFFKLKR